MTVPGHPPYLPAALAESVATWEDDTAARWVDELPARLGRLAAAWDLEIGEPFDPGGVTAWVAPVETPDGRAVLKVVVPHREARDEGPALRAWNGLGAPRLIADAPDEHALLMERCEPGTPLSDLDDPETVVDVGAEVLSRLWRARPGPSDFEHLSAVADWFADLVEERRERFRDDSPIDPALTDRAVELLRTLPRTADREVLLHHDLHPGNVLLDAERGWLAIDPKPQIGDPAFDPVQLVLQSSDPLGDPDPSRTVRRRVERLSVLLDVDADRLAAWGLARCVEWAHYELAHQTRDGAARHAARAALFAAV